MDLISCRNVLIYLGPVLQNKVLPIFHYALKLNGYLMLGSAESVGTPTDLFNPVDVKHKIYVRSSVPSRLLFDFTPGGRTQVVGAVTGGPHAPVRAIHDIQREVDRIVLAKYAPAGVAIDEQLQIVQFRGQTGRYLAPPAGAPTTDLMLMAREELLPDLRTAIATAKAEHYPVRKKGIRIKTNADFDEVRLNVTPIKVPTSDEQFFLVLFEIVEPGRDVNAPLSSPADQQAPAEERERERLRQELSATKNYLHSIIEQYKAANEELKAANEEIISSNEELQSTNEELETAKEELQTTNEELTTVNDELRHRMQVATQLSDDLTNLIDSVNIPTVVLGNDLRIRRISPSAQRVLNLMPGDIGRRMGHIKPTINVSDLEPFVREVLDTLVTKEREVFDQEGRWYRMTIRPYKTTEHKIDGAVVTLTDVDAIKRREQQVEEARDYALSIVETVREPLVILDGELRVKTANQAFYRTFQLSAEETERELLYAVGNGRLNIPGLRKLLEDVLPKSKQLQNCEITHRSGDQGERALLINARRLQQRGESSEQLILLAIEDVTQRRLDQKALQITEARIQAIVESATDAIITADRAGMIESFNPAAETIFGYAAEEVVGQNVSILMPEPYRGEHDAYMAKYLRTRQPTVIGIGRELTGRRKDGSVFPIELAVAEIDHMQHFTGFIRDITRRKQLEREVLEVAASEQRRIGQDFHDGVGQELTGLRYMAGTLADMLADKGGPEADLASKISGDTKNALEHARALSRGLIPVDVDGQGLMAALDRLASRTCQVYGIACTFSYDLPVLVPDNTSATQLYRIAQEATINAIRHGEPQHVSIRLREAEGAIQLGIVDDGQGFQNPDYSEQGAGIRIMQYRAGVIGALLQIGPADPRGTQVLCTLTKDTHNAKNTGRFDNTTVNDSTG